MVFGQVIEALEKTSVSLKEKSWVEAKFEVVVAAEYILACFVSPAGNSEEAGDASDVGDEDEGDDDEAPASNSSSSSHSRRDAP
ncbi:hypothetical protein E2562_024484 [Oryza meyeriana var. granulata]|uniref:Uncharacterized protein n=1 Tax=Oryza meyeriana var. granulata TaxID=110450 RepID=A0A6G1FBP3_9ORYZ|nr:hypothetical protein E2562_024484 [Oryza meyeriana var. granulata]